MNELSPCVLPRRRLVLWFLGGCVLWVVGCAVYTAACFPGSCSVRPSM